MLLIILVTVCLPAATIEDELGYCTDESDCAKKLENPLYKYSGADEYILLIRVTNNYKLTLMSYIVIAHQIFKRHIIYHIFPGPLFELTYILYTYTIILKLYCKANLETVFAGESY